MGGGATCGATGRTTGRFGCIARALGCVSGSTAGNVLACMVCIAMKWLNIACCISMDNPWNGDTIGIAAGCTATWGISACCADTLGGTGATLPGCIGMTGGTGRISSVVSGTTGRIKGTSSTCLGITGGTGLAGGTGMTGGNSKGTRPCSTVGVDGFLGVGSD